MELISSRQAFLRPKIKVFFYKHNAYNFSENSLIYLDFLLNKAKTKFKNLWKISHRGGKSVGNFPSRWEIDGKFPTAVGNRWEISHRGGKSMGNFPSRWEFPTNFPPNFFPNMLSSSRVRVYRETRPGYFYKFE